MLKNFNIFLIKNIQHVNIEKFKTDQTYSECNLAIEQIVTKSWIAMSEAFEAENIWLPNKYLPLKIVV